MMGNSYTCSKPSGPARSVERRLHSAQNLGGRVPDGRRVAALAFRQPIFQQQVHQFDQSGEGSPDVRC
jgi:hypothetical protein